MLQSPAKRRKITATTSIVATDHNTNTANRSAPTTPTRASYLSPTKASLARSHPHLVSNENQRSQKEPRARHLRDEVLGKKDLSHQPAPAATFEAPDKPPQQSETTKPQAKEASTTQSAAITSIRAPLLQRQPSARTERYSTSESPDPIPPKVIPTLVKRSEATETSNSRLRDNNFDLPPTPVELGLDAPPERPKGLSSSSPRGSSSGSARRRRRVLDGQSVASSPLKPNATRVAMDDLDGYSEVAPEALESQASGPEADDENVPEELKEKSKTMRDLMLELNKLQAEVRELEGAVKENEMPNTVTSRESLLSLFKTLPKSYSSEKREFEPEAAGEDLLQFHNLFAPGNLQLQSRISTKVIKSHAVVVHQFRITAPVPWPQRVFSANFEVVTDAEEVRVEKIAWMDVLKGHTQARGIQDELHGWILQRLKHELHRLDAGGLIWGIGNYFNASVARAKSFRSLATEYHAREMDQDRGDEAAKADDGNDATQPESKSEQLSEDEAVELSQYLDKSQITFELNSGHDSAMTTRRTRKVAPKIILVWKLEPMWHGEIRSRPEIVVSGVPEAAEESIIELFEKVKNVSGIEKAFEAVWKMMSKIGETDQDSRGGGQSTSKAPAKKRKRFT